MALIAPFKNIKPHMANIFCLERSIHFSCWDIGTSCIKVVSKYVFELDSEGGLGQVVKVSGVELSCVVCETCFQLHWFSTPNFLL